MNRVLIFPNGDWYIAKRRGNRVRYRNRRTAAWDGWTRIWSPFNADGSFKDLESEGWHVLGAIK